MTKTLVKNQTETGNLPKPSRPRRIARRKPDAPPPVTAEQCGVPRPYPRSLRARLIALLGCRVILTALPKPRPADAPARDKQLPSFCRFETFFVSVAIKGVADGADRILRVHRYDELPRLLDEAAPEDVTLRVYMPTRLQHPKERGEGFMWQIPLVCVLGIRPVEDDGWNRGMDYLTNKVVAARKRRDVCLTVGGVPQNAEFRAATATANQSSVTGGQAS